MACPAHDFSQWSIGDSLVLMTTDKLPDRSCYNPDFGSEYTGGTWTPWLFISCYILPVMGTHRPHSVV